MLRLRTHFVSLYTSQRAVRDLPVSQLDVRFTASHSKYTCDPSDSIQNCPILFTSSIFKVIETYFFTMSSLIDLNVSVSLLVFLPLPLYVCLSLCLSGDLYAFHWRATCSVKAMYLLYYEDSSAHEFNSHLFKL